MADFTEFFYVTLAFTFSILQVHQLVPDFLLSCFCMLLHSAYCSYIPYVHNLSTEDCSPAITLQHCISTMDPAFLILSLADYVVASSIAVAVVQSANYHIYSIL